MSKDNIAKIMALCNELLASYDEEVIAYQVGKDIIKMLEEEGA